MYVFVVVFICGMFVKLCRFCFILVGKKAAVISSDQCQVNCSSHFFPGLGLINNTHPPWCCWPLELEWLSEGRCHYPNSADKKLIHWKG